MDKLSNPNKEIEQPTQILIIEDDEAQHRLLKDQISDAFPISEIDFATEGETAWELLQEKNYELVILDWRLFGNIHGPALLNRLRHHENYQQTPILVVSGYLKVEDFSLIDEFPFTGCLHKPYRPVFLVKKMKDLFKECKWFRRKEIELCSLFSNATKDPSRFLPELIAVCEASPRPFLLLLHTIKILRVANFYEEALSLLSRATTLNPSSVGLLSEEGKIMLAMGENKKAINALQKARKMSPKNLERLCDLGTLNLKELNTEAASEAFAEGLTIDPQNKIANDGLKLTGNMDSFFKNTAPSRVPHSFAGLLNAIGIALVRGGDINTGISHYQSAINYANIDQDKAKLAFNLGLGYLKQDQKNEAKAWFQQSIDLEPAFAKPRKHLERINKFLAPKPQAEQAENNKIKFDDSLASDPIPLFKVTENNPD